MMFGIITPTYFLMDNLATVQNLYGPALQNNKWSNAANWSSGDVPGSGQNIIVNNNANTEYQLGRQSEYRKYHFRFAPRPVLSR